MMKARLSLTLLVLAASAAQAQVRVASPNRRTQVTVQVQDGKLYYSVQRDGRALLMPSLLGFEFRGAPTLRDSLRIVDTTRQTADETWTQPWGEVAHVRDHHNELRVSVRESAAPNRQFTLAVRVFDDGIGFRYEFPDQPNLGAFEMTEELTEFSMADDARAWWIPSNRPRLDRSEILYSSSPVSVIDSIQTPLTMETRDGKAFVVIHEANLVDYARMNLRGGRLENRTLHAALAPYADGVKVRGHTPFVTPWRTIQIADRATDLSPSVLGLNLNPPSVIANTGWIKPMKYVGIWWGMHINTMTWNSGPKHGATTANTKRYIDFAAANGFGGVLVEGWNVGWDGDWIQNRNAFSFTSAYPDYDLPEVARYAHEKGVKLIVHNETSGGIENYERQMDSAFALYHSLGLDAIKSGYVTDLTSAGDSHHGQVMVRHYRHVIEMANKYGIMLERGPADRSTTPGAPRAGTRLSTRRFSSSLVCSPAPWTSRRASSTSSESTPVRGGSCGSRGCAPRWPSSWPSTWSCTRRSRWPPTCPRTTRVSRRSSSSATWRSTGTRPACSRGRSATTWWWRAASAMVRAGSSGPSPMKKLAASTSRSRSSGRAGATSPRSMPTGPEPDGTRTRCR